jgi:hypothetical protein
MFDRGGRPATPRHHGFLHHMHHRGTPAQRMSFGSHCPSCWIVHSDQNVEIEGNLNSCTVPSEQHAWFALCAGHHSLGQDRTKQAGPDDLACMHRHGDTTGASHMFELSVGSFLDNEHPAQLPEPLDDFARPVIRGSGGIQATVGGRCDSSIGGR